MRATSRAHAVPARAEVPTPVDHGRGLSRLRVPALPALSPREIEIVRLVAKGYPNKTIAGILEISTWTVAAHLRRIYLKLGVHSRAAMVARTLAHLPGR